MVDDDISLRTARRFLKHVSVSFKDFKPKEIPKPKAVETTQVVQTVVVEKKRTKKSAGRFARKSSPKKRCPVQSNRKECNIDQIEVTLNQLVDQNSVIKDMLEDNLKTVSKLDTRVQKLEGKKVATPGLKSLTIKTVQKTKPLATTKKEIIKIQVTKPKARKIVAPKDTKTKTVIQTTTITKEETLNKPVDPETVKRIEHLEAQYQNLKDMGYDPFYLAKIRERIESLKKNL